MFNRNSSAGTAAQKRSKWSLLSRLPLLLAILLLSAVCCQGQIGDSGLIFSPSHIGSYSIINNNNGFDFNDCGTWEPQPDYYTDWESVDTLKKIPIKDTIRRWVYSPEKMQISNMVTLEYAPCGNGRPTTWEQQRICELTGIRQKRYRVRTYKYIPKPKTEYQKVVDSLSRNSR
jgi:hypothetical protein